MNKIIRTSLSLIILLVLAACNIFAPRTPSAVDIQALRLTVQTQGGVNTFGQVGEIINYNYVISYTGSTPLTGAVTITDAPRQATCPALNTIGDSDNFLEANESITCTAAYSVTESDFNAGSIINVATATVGGVISNQSGVTLTRTAPTPSAVLRLSKTASSTTYGQVGQTITYTYVVTNAGTTPLGPTQFTISDNKLGAPFNCGDPNITLAPNQSLNCAMPYVITQTDLSSANLTNTATASGAGQTSAPATTTVTNLTLTQTAPGQTQAPPSNLPPGTTIQHTVAVGEWLYQITRCYGATFTEVRAANPQISNPNIVLLPMTVTVPRIGSAGRIYGPPCVTFQNVQSGDTWNSIAQRYNACVAVLQRVNPVSLTAGTSIKVPNNSAGLYCPGSSTSPSTAVSPSITPGTTAAQRITIDPGQTTATRIGIINPNERIQFVLSASQGQTLAIRLTAPANEVAVGVNGPTGLILKPLDPTPTWSAVIANGGDHTINLAAVLGNSSKSYTLEVSLTSTVPTSTFTTVPPTPTATATSTPG